MHNPAQEHVENDIDHNEQYHIHVHLHTAKGHFEHHEEKRYTVHRDIEPCIHRIDTSYVERKRFQSVQWRGSNNAHFLFVLPLPLLSILQ